MPTKKQLVAGLAAGVVVGGVVYALTRKSGAPQDDDADFVAPNTTAPVTAPTETQTKPVAAPAPSAVSPSTGASAQFTKEYSFRDNDANEKMLEEALAEQELAAPSAKSSEVLEDGSVVFKHLGASLIPPAGWTVKEEQTPMPNVAMIAVTKPEFAEKLQSGPEDMGSVPVIILSVEDISSQNLDLLEFKDRSKQMAISQMAAMTGGMVQPIMKFDDGLSVGPFRHCLEYAQSLPPYFELTVSNLITVSGGFAYVFQIMCSPKVMSTFKPVFMEIARTVKIFETKGPSVGAIELVTNQIKLSCNPTWSWSRGKENALVTLTTPSAVKSEEVLVYETNAMPNNVVKSEKTVDGVVVATLNNHCKSYTHGEFVAIVKPLMKPSIHTSDAEFIRAVKSITRVDTKETIAQYVNDEHGYAFRMLEGGKLIASRAGGGTVVYAPTGLDDSGPTVTIRVGNPETDGDCAEDLDGWEERMRSEEAGGNITGLQRVTRAGQPCLTFQSKDMQEVGPGERVEMVGKVFIFVNKGHTTLIRWETTTGQWRRFENKMEEMIGSIKLI